ncbi:MAG: dihydrodipicolinate synthase family protein [Victivallales bacterium]|nr:dihydrodipicolinate synthase family protein [Victivallales bacterium]
MKRLKLSGLLAAPFTPFTEDGSIDWIKIPKLADALVADGVTGAYVCGTTGEGISCTLEERKELLAAWAAAAKGRLTLIAHTGASALGEVEVLNRRAVELGYDAVSAIPTTFFRPANEEALVEYCRLAAASAPEVPFYYYHTMNARLELSPSRFLELAAERIPTLGGIKFNHHNLYEFQLCKEFAKERYDIVFGVDEFFAGALALGATAFIGSTYNYSASLYQDIWEAFRQADWPLVHEGMRKVCEAVKLLNQYGGLPAGKAMMGVKGLDCGPARAPLRQLNASQRAAVADELAKCLGR